MKADSFTLTQLLENIHDPVFIVNKNGFISDKNQAALKISGYNKKKIINSNIHDIFPFNTTEFKNKFHVIPLDESTHVESLHFSADDIHFELEVIPLYIENIIRFYMIFVRSGKTTGINKMKDKILREYLEKEQLKKFSIKSIAHDLNNIIMILQTNFELLSPKLEKALPDSFEFREIRYALSKAINLTNNFFQNLDNKKYILNINTLIKAMYQFFVILICKHKNIKVNLDLASDIWSIYANTLDIERIILNLVLNAREALSDYGEINIKTENKEITKDCITRKYICFSIEDTGIGIEETRQEAIFKENVSSKGSANNFRGFGLAIISSIIKQLGGFIKLISRPGDGASFHIYIPAVFTYSAENYDTMHYAIKDDTVKRDDNNLNKNKLISHNKKINQGKNNSQNTFLNKEEVMQHFSSLSESRDHKSALKYKLESCIIKNINKNQQNLFSSTSLQIKNLKEIIFIALIELARLRDTETGYHLKRIGEYSKILAKELKYNDKYKNLIDDNYISTIYFSSQLHDIGKVGIPDSILLKKSFLTDNENEIMKTHTLLGGNVLKQANALLGNDSFLNIAEQIAYYHHEKWTGSGYMKGLSGEDIPVCARITALADVYDACTTKRVYKEAYSHENTRSIIENEAGNHFDPDIVDAFFKGEKEFDSIRQEYE